MGRGTTLLSTLTVTSLLFVGLLALVPGAAEPASVTQVTVGAVVNPNGSAGPDGDEAVTIRVTVDIPEGEHIPLNHARVLLAPGDSTTSGGVLQGVLCETGVSSDASATITNVDGAPRVEAEFTGFGYGYAGGAGYGYGYDAGGVRATVTVKVTGCLPHIDGAMNANGFGAFAAQVFLGGDDEHVLPGALTTAFLASPFATGTGAMVADASGITVAGGAVAAGTTQTFNLGTAAPLQKVAMKTLEALEPGTRVHVHQDDEVDRDEPAFGLGPLNFHFPQAAPALQFQFELEGNDGASSADLNGRATFTVDIHIPPSYFAGLPAGLDKDDFKVFAYGDDGGLKAHDKQPATTLKAGATPHTYQVTISHFSSFVAGATHHVADTPDDPDGDGIPASSDNCPSTRNPTQTDADGDDIGDACDFDPADGPLGDLDGDGHPNGVDLFPTDPTESADVDEDGIGDNADLDDDNDTVPDLVDNCPLVENLDQADLDGDGVGDACSDDWDGDGTPNAQDAFPKDPAETRDTDGDGVGDNRDADDDNDGIRDVDEVDMGTDPLDPSDPSTAPVDAALLRDARNRLHVRWMGAAHPGVTEYRVVASGSAVFATVAAGAPGQAHSVIVADGSGFTLVARGDRVPDGRVALVEADACTLGASDADGDGLCFGDELLLGTSDNNADSDGDGSSDRDEVTAGTDPADSLSSPAETDSVVAPGPEPVSGGGGGGMAAWVWIVLALVVVAGGAIAGYIIRRNRQDAMPSAGGPPTAAAAQPPMARTRPLVQEGPRMSVPVRRPGAR